MRKKINGSGAISVVRPARSAVAPTVPRRSYIGPAKRGKAAANIHRRALLLAIAEAEIGRYAVTRYMKVDMKEKNMPAPSGTEAIMGTIQGMPE